MNAFQPQRPVGRTGGAGPPSRPGMVSKPEQPPANLPASYLKDGYFDKQGNLRPELVVEEAITVARALGRRQGQVELKTAQLRRFYGKARNVEQKLDSGQPFASLGAEILTIQPLAANTVARGLAPDVFKDFIDRNIALAYKNEKDFRQGFLVHFQSVVAYFTYFSFRR